MRALFLAIIWPQTALLVRPLHVCYGFYVGEAQHYLPPVEGIMIL